MRKTSRILFLGLFIIIAILLAVFTGRRLPKTYIASGHPEYPPIMWRESDAIVGVGPALVKLVFEELEVNIESKHTGLWDEVQDNARQGSIDVIVAAYVNEERLTYMDYSTAYIDDPVVVLVKKGNKFPFSEWSDLKERKGVTTVGESYGQKFDDYMKGSLIVERVDTVEEAFHQLIAGHADYQIFGLYPTQVELAAFGHEDEIEILPNHVVSEKFYITISKQSPLVKYLPQVNEILERYLQDGTIDRLLEEYRAKALEQ